MLKSGIVILALIACFFCQPSFGITDVPDHFLSEAFIAYGGPGVPSLLVVPDGVGNPFTEAFDEQGNVVDATITLHLRDSQGMPFFFFPREDLWLETVDGGLVSCIWGLIADDHTDHNGMTQWIEPAIAGGYSEGPVLVFVNGSPLTSNPGLPLRFNSPDINGDLVVNLADVVIFAGDYFSGYQYRSDLVRDGVLNLSDIALFSLHVGAHCP
jgi:hypothetical protein